MNENLKEQPGILINKIREVDGTLANQLEYAISAQGLSLQEVKRGLSILQRIDTTKFTSTAVSFYQRKNFIVKFIEVLRNLLVFLPILLTWLSLSAALNAYSEYVLKTKDGASSFLMLWQSGFSGQLTNWLRFSNVAILDAWIVGLIILLTMISSIRNYFKDEEAIDKAIRLQNNIDNLIWDLEGVLYNKYSVIGSTDQSNLEALILQFENLATTLKNQSESILNYLAAEHHRLTNYSGLQKEELETVRNASSTYFEATSQVVDLIVEIRKGISSWESSMEQQTLAIMEYGDKFEAGINYIRKILEYSETTSQKISDLSQAEIGILDELGDSSGRFTNAAHSIKNDIRTLDQNIASLKDNILSYNNSMTSDKKYMDAMSQLQQSFPPLISETVGILNQQLVTLDDISNVTNHIANKLSSSDHSSDNGQGDRLNNTNNQTFHRVQTTKKRSFLSKMLKMLRLD